MPNVGALDEIASYQTEADASLRLFYSPANPKYDVQFQGFLPSEINSRLNQRLVETKMRSTLITISIVEAAFHMDFKARCRLKLTDSISTAFRKIYKKKKGQRVHFDEDILEVWKQHIEPQSSFLIGQLRSMLHFRHWLAHGRYWNPKQKFAYQDSYLLAVLIIAEFPFQK